VAALDDLPLVQVDDRAAWHAWLAANHATSPGVWLVTWRRDSGRTPLDYESMIEEALCFGWVDGQGGRVDELRSKLHISPRRRGSVWAATNKARVERLIADGRMAPAGLAAIERAKADGSWTVLDGPERLEVPDDEHWASFSPSSRKMMLGWIAVAKRSETRAARIAETARRAAMGEKASERPPRD
jgi:uncharacterized protein YdeI (YjbR/CyaY-like superfamily)